MEIRPHLPVGVNILLPVFQEKVSQLPNVRNLQLKRHQTLYIDRRTLSEWHNRAQLQGVSEAANSETLLLILLGGVCDKTRSCYVAQDSLELMVLLSSHGAWDGRHEPSHPTHNFEFAISVTATPPLLGLVLLAMAASSSDSADLRC